MTDLPHLPALRRGRPYASLDKVSVKDCRTGAPVAQVSQVNSGIIRKDMGRIGEAKAALSRLTTEQLLAICSKASDLFLNATLPLGDGGQNQTPDQYVALLSRTSGLPHVMIRRNMAKISAALANMRQIVAGLTRGLPAQILDAGYGEVHGTRVAFYPAAECLGLVMPSNSPAVNSLWLPAVALKTPLVLKPGREEPWTPYRLIQSFVAAGCPAEAFGFYPTDHEGSGEILRTCGRALVFGDKATTAQYAGNPAIQVHGPGFSKIIFGEDLIEKWPDYVDLMVSSISDNGGRSCINTSAIVVPRYASEIADALAQKLGPLMPDAPESYQARLAAFANPQMAAAIDATIEEGLRVSGAIDSTAAYRTGPRRVEVDGATYLRPCIIHCESFLHPLANREFLFPYASVVTVPEAEMLSQIGPSLVVTALTTNSEFRAKLMSCPQIDRLNLGPISTMHVSWDQPHEGNLFEFLYRRRALEIAS